MLKDARSFQASHVFTTPAERDAVAERLQKQYQEHFEPKISEMAKQSGMSSDDFLRSQGIQPIQYRPDDFILASQNPLRGSTEKKIKAFMTMTGNTQSISGGTGEHRRHTGYYRPSDFKHVRSMLTTDVRRLKDGTANLGEMEGLYLPASQKMEARAAQNIFKNGLTEDLLNNEKHPVVEKMRSDMLKQYAQEQLKAKVKKGLQDEELLPPDEEGGRGKKEPSAGSKALKATGIVISKILSVAGDLKSLFNVAVSYLKSIAGEIAGLKQDAGTLGITTDQALKLKNLARMNPVYAPDENVYLNAAKGVLGFTSDPTKVKNINWDSVVLQKEEKLIRPILEAATSGRIKPVDTMNAIYNTLGKEYYSADPKFREEILTRQKAALEALDPSLASGYQTAIDVTKNYKLINDKNKHNIMGAFMNFVEGSSTKSAIREAMGMSTESNYGSDADQTELNTFLRVLEEIKEALKSLVVIRFDDLIRLISSLIEALLMLGSLFDGSDGPADQLLEEFRQVTAAKGEKQYGELANNYAMYKNEVSERLKQAGYIGPNADNFMNQIVTAPDEMALMEILKNPKTGIPSHGPKFLRELFIAADLYRLTSKEIGNYNSKSPEDRGLVKSYTFKNAIRAENISRNRALHSIGQDGVGTKGHKSDFNIVKQKKFTEKETKENENRLKAEAVLREYNSMKDNMRYLPPDEQEAYRKAMEKQLQKYDPNGTLPPISEPKTKSPYNIMLNDYTTPGLMNMTGNSGSVLTANNGSSVIRHDVNIFVNDKIVVRESNNLDATNNKIITNSIRATV